MSALLLSSHLSIRHKPYAAAAVKHCHKLRTSSQYRDACGRVLLVGSDLLQEVVLYKRPEGPIHVHSLLVRNRCEPPTGASLLGMPALLHLQHVGAESCLSPGSMCIDLRLRIHTLVPTLWHGRGLAAASLSQCFK